MMGQWDDRTIIPPSDGPIIFLIDSMRQLDDALALGHFKWLNKG